MKRRKPLSFTLFPVRGKTSILFSGGPNRTKGGKKGKKENSVVRFSVLFLYLLQQEEWGGERGRTEDALIANILHYLSLYCIEKVFPFPRRKRNEGKGRGKF